MSDPSSPLKSFTLSNISAENLLEYTRKTKGLPLSQRIETLSKQLEERVIRDLKKIEANLGEEEKSLEYSAPSDSYSETKFKKLETFSSVSKKPQKSYFGSASSKKQEKDNFESIAYFNLDTDSSKKMQKSNLLNYNNENSDDESKKIRKSGTLNNTNENSNGFKKRGKEYLLNLTSENTDGSKQNENSKQNDNLPEFHDDNDQSFKKITKNNYSSENENRSAEKIMEEWRIISQRETSDHKAYKKINFEITRTDEKEEETMNKLGGSLKDQESSKKSKWRAVQKKLISLLEKAFVCMNEKRFDETISICLENENIFNRFFNENGRTQIYFYSLLIRSFLEIQKFEEAMHFCEKANYILEKHNFPLKDDNVREVLVFNGFCHFQLNNYEKAIEFFENAKPFVSNSSQLQEIHFSLGMCYYKIKQYENSLPYFSNLSDYLETNPQKYLLIVLKSSEMLVDLGQHELAISYYENLIMNINKFNLNSKGLIDIFWNMTLTYYKNGDADDTITLLGKIIENLNIIKDNTDFLGICYFLRGNKCHEIKKYADAGDDFEQASLIFGTLHGKDNYLTLNSLINAAENLYFSRKFSKSLEIYETILEIKDNDQEDFSEISRYFLNIIYLSNMIGKKEKNQKYFETLMKRLKKNDDVEFAIYNELGNLFLNSSKYNEAMTMYNSALKIYEESEKKLEYVPFLVFVYINMGTCFNMSKMYKEAVKYMNLALDLNIKLNGEKNEINKTIYLNLSEIYSKIERFEESKSYLKKGKQLC